MSTLRVRITALLMVVVMSFGSTGCYHNEIIVSRTYVQDVNKAPNYTNAFQTYLLFGLIPVSDNPIDLSSICQGRGAGYIEVEMSVINSIINIFLGWLVAFQDIKVWCN